MSVEKVCVVCGKSFSVPPCRAETATACSNKCSVVVRAKSRERKLSRVCPNCGVTFEFPQSHKNRRIYCSTECKYGSTDYRDDIRERTHGEDNPMWNGGETDHCDGYIYKRVSGHPYSCNGYVLKHRRVMEEWLMEDCPKSEYLIRLGGSLYLAPKAIVHHRNWVRSDNRRQNLIVCWQPVHSGIHNGNAPEPGSYWPAEAKIKLGKRSPII